MGCWHGPGHGCGPGPYWQVPPPRDWCGSPDEEDWYEDVRWPMRRRVRRRPADPEVQAEQLLARLEELREELQRVEVALGELTRPGRTPPAE